MTDLDTALPALDVPDVEVLPITSIRPYWRNPRVISAEAIEAVKESIRRYGYRVPIVVDGDHVIVTGHTRYAALIAAGVTEVPVIVARDLTPEQASEFRLVDNRTSELTEWNMDDLLVELRTVDPTALEAFFPEVDLNATLDKLKDVTDAATARATEKVNAAAEGADDPRTVDLRCPHCLGQIVLDAASIADLVVGITTPEE